MQMNIKDFDPNKSERDGFKAVYWNGGGFADFKGKIMRRKKGGWCCFGRIYISLTTLDGFVEEHTEDHVWIQSREKFAGLKCGDCIAFSGEVAPYRRMDGTCELGIINPDYVEKIESYDLPSDEKIFEQSMKDLKCDLCLFSEQCNRQFCLL